MSFQFSDRPERCRISTRWLDFRLSCNSNSQLSSKTSNPAWEQWLLIPIPSPNDKKLVFLRSCAFGTFLVLYPDGKLGVDYHALYWEKWQLEVSPHHGHFLTSYTHTKRLACNDMGHLSSSHQSGGSETWSLEIVSDNNSDTLTSFPCFEQQPRCYLSSICHNNRLSSLENNSVCTTEKRDAQQEWQLIPVSSGKVHVRSCHHNLLLNSSPKGRVGAFENMNNGWDEWCIQKTPNRGVMFVSNEHGKRLSCNNGGHIYSADKQGDDQQWRIELLTGELCFVSLALTDERIHYSSSGLQMSKEWNGYEVWSFVEAGDESVSIVSSVTGIKNALCSDAAGNVFMTDDVLGNCSKWILDKSPQSYGVSIRSASHGMLLCYTDKFKTCTKNYKFEDWSSIWRLEAAHRSQFFISSHHHKWGTSRNESRSFMTADRTRWKKWTIKLCCDGVFEIFASDGEKMSIFSEVCEKCTSSTFDDCDCVSSEDSKKWVKWMIEKCSTGGYFFVSDVLSKHLTCKNNGQLVAVSGLLTEQDAWNLEPVMPKGFTADIIPAVMDPMEAIIPCNFRRPHCCLNIK